MENGTPPSSIYQASPYMLSASKPSGSKRNGAQLQISATVIGVKRVPLNDIKSTVVNSLINNQIKKNEILSLKNSYLNRN